MDDIINKRISPDPFGELITKNLVEINSTQKDLLKVEIAILNQLQNKKH